MPNIEDLYLLHGEFINMEYPLPNEKYVKLLNNDETYIGNQVECIFNNEEMKKYFGLLLYYCKENRKNES